jgi:hypothetical protein
VEDKEFKEPEFSGRVEFGECVFPVQIGRQKQEESEKKENNRRRIYKLFNKRGVESQEC